MRRGSLPYRTRQYQTHGRKEEECRMTGPGLAHPNIFIYEDLNSQKFPSTYIHLIYDVRHSVVAGG
jgi:hypothetical protein